MNDEMIRTLYNLPLDDIDCTRYDECIGCPNYIGVGVKIEHHMETKCIDNFVHQLIGETGRWSAVLDVAVNNHE